MWRVIVGSLLAAIVSIGPAWAIPTNVSFAGALDCSGPCVAGTTLTVGRSVPGDAGNSDGAVFEDHYSFSLTGPVDMAGKGFAIDLDSGFNVEDLAFALFGPGMTNLGSFSVPNGDGGVFQVPLSFASLATGAYTLLVSGIIPTGFDGGLYLFDADLTQTAVSQVPLPPAILMFLSALVGMFSLTQMRKRSSTA
jgi:hypothetical protein